MHSPQDLESSSIDWHYVQKLFLSPPSYGKHVSMLCSFWATIACLSAAAVVLSFASPTLTEMKQPSVSMTDVSVGRRVPPHSCVSLSEKMPTLMRLSTHLNCEASVHLPSALGKLTLRKTSSGRKGLPLATTALVSVVASSA